MFRRDRQLTLLFGLALILAFLLRVWGLGAQSLWYDEGFSVDLAAQGWRQILLGELNLPPLYNLLLAGWMRLAGPSEFAVRYLSAFFGLLIVALGGVLGGLLLGRRAGALAALLLAVSPIEVWYAQEARMYALLGALTLASTVILVRLLDGERRPALWAGYAVANIASVYTHYYAALVLAAQAVWVLVHVLSRRDWRLGRSWLVAQGSLGLAFAPWLPVLLGQWRAANTTYWPGALSLGFVVRESALGFVGLGQMVPAPVAWALALGGGLLVVLGLGVALLRAPRRRGVLLLLVHVVVPFLLFFALVHSRPKFSPRYLLPIVPALTALAGGAGAAVWPQGRRGWREWLWTGLVGVVVSGVAVGSAFAATNPLRDGTLGRDDLRGAARWLSRHVGPDEAVILLSGHLAPAFAYYYHRDNCFPMPPGLPATPSVYDVVSIDILDDLNRAIEGRSGVWLLLWQDDVVDPTNVVRTVLDRTGKRVTVERQFRGLSLRHYVFAPGTRLERDKFGRHPLDLAVGQSGLKLMSCDLPARAQPGRKATVLLFWQAERPIQGDCRISFRVMDEQGQERARHDAALAAQFYPTNRWPPGQVVMGKHEIGLPLAMPPGEYTLLALVYRGEDTLATLTVGTLQVVRSPEQPSPARLGIGQPLGERFGELELLGYNTWPRQVAPGETLYLTLFWRALARPAQRYRISLFLDDRRWASPMFPASVTQMEPGDVFQLRYPLKTAEEAAEGQGELRLTLEDENGRGVREPFGLTGLAVRIRERAFAAPAHIGSPRQVDLGGKITFLGHDLNPTPARPGDTLHLTLYWRAERSMQRDYTVWVRLPDGQGDAWVQAGATPVHGTRPTTDWMPGEVVTDDYELALPAGVPAGQYRLEAGLCEPDTGQRLPAYDEAGSRLAGDSITLGPIEVR